MSVTVYFTVGLSAFKLSEKSCWWILLKFYVVVFFSALTRLGDRMSTSIWHLNSKSLCYLILIHRGFSPGEPAVRMEMVMMVTICVMVIPGSVNQW